MVVVRIGMMVVSLGVAIGMIVGMIVRMIVILALAVMGGGVMTRGTRANTLHMVVMGFLCQADLIFKAQNRFSILAVHAVHQVRAIKDFLHAVGKGIEDQRMIA